MLAVTAAQMRKIEELSINDYGVPGIVLMENAAIRVAEEVISVMAKKCGQRSGPAENSVICRSGQ